MIIINLTWKKIIVLATVWGATEGLVDAIFRKLGW
jgi:hypothetical protein